MFSFFIYIDYLVKSITLVRISPYFSIAVSPLFTKKLSMEISDLSCFSTVLLIFLSQEVKKSYIAAIPLFVYLILVVIHIVQLLSLSQEFTNIRSILMHCIGIDFVFIAITFFAYLWVDDVEVKVKGKNSIDNSLEWMWKKV